MQVNDCCSIGGKEGGKRNYNRSCGLDEGHEDSHTLESMMTMKKQMIASKGEQDKRYVHTCTQGERENCNMRRRICKARDKQIEGGKMSLKRVCNSPMANLTIKCERVVCSPFIRSFDAFVARK